MKKIKFLLLGLLISSFNMHAQINVSFGTPPVWAPADRVETQYYYLPEIDSYYDVPSSQFIYVKNGTWFRSKSLPSRYNAYNLNRARVVYITDYKGNKPYSYHKAHKLKYYKKSNVYLVKNKHYNKGKGKGHGKGHKD